MTFRLKALLVTGALLSSSAAALAAPATATTQLNVRSGPGTGYGVIDTLPPGERVNLIGCDGAWCEISMGRDGSGFVSEAYLEQGGSVRSRVIVEEEPEIIGLSIGGYWDSRPYYIRDGYYYYGGRWYGDRPGRPGWRDRSWRRWDERREARRDRFEDRRERFEDRRDRFEDRRAERRDDRRDGVTGAFDGRRGDDRRRDDDRRARFQDRGGERPNSRPERAEQRGDRGEERAGVTGLSNVPSQQRVDGGAERSGGDSGDRVGLDRAGSGGGGGSMMRGGGDVGQRSGDGGGRGGGGGRSGGDRN